MNIKKLIILMVSHNVLKCYKFFCVIRVSWYLSTLYTYINKTYLSCEKKKSKWKRFDITVADTVYVIYWFIVRLPMRYYCFRSGVSVLIENWFYDVLQYEPKSFQSIIYKAMIIIKFDKTNGNNWSRRIL